MNINLKLGETDFNNSDVKLQLEHQIQFQETKNIYILNFCCKYYQ